GAPWTSGSASVPVEGGQEVETGSIDLLGDGYLRVRLVTPIAIEIHEPPESIPSLIAAFGLLRFEIAPVPEPGGASGGLAGVGALSWLARRRRPRSQPR
ncbi:MAG TPA: MYXO-CTERM sorting domain-containing protein, partial [Myxococcota bacterium]|nr:MYXO-CTERM sorting domain-containing protein [Myxococcota bacterium]